MNTPENQQDNAVPAPHIGQVLQAEREKRNYSLQEVALQLKLKVEVVKGLESNQLDSSILPTYVRGYIRAYARFLKLPERELLSRFDADNKENKPAVKLMKTFSNREAKQKTEARFVWFSYVFVGILIISLSFWLWQQSREFGLELTNTEGIAHIPTTTVDVSAFENLELSATENVPLLAEDGTAETIELEMPTAGADIPLVGSNVDVVFENAESFGDSTDTDLDRLKMTFTDNCWIDVLDGNGERIAYGTKLAGYVMELNAKGPFTVTLGNPSVVAIDINQKPFDMSGFPGGRVAKFTLAGQHE